MSYARSPRAVCSTTIGTRVIAAHLGRLPPGRRGLSAAVTLRLMSPCARLGPAIPALARDLAATRGQRSLLRDRSPPAWVLSPRREPRHRARVECEVVSRRSAVTRRGAGHLFSPALAGSAEA